MDEKRWILELDSLELKAIEMRWDDSGVVSYISFHRLRHHDVLFFILNWLTGHSLNGDQQEEEDRVSRGSPHPLVRTDCG